MNCRPGDLAVIVKCTPSTTHALGHVVRVVRPDGRRDYTTMFGIPDAQTWVCEFDRPVVNHEQKVRDRWAVPDFALRPIRPGDISDEEVRELYAPKLPEVA